MRTLGIILGSLVVIVLSLWGVDSWRMRSLALSRRSDLLIVEKSLAADWVGFDAAAQLRDGSPGDFALAMKSTPPIAFPFGNLPDSSDEPSVRNLQKRVDDYNGCRTTLILYRGESHDAGQLQRTKSSLDSCMTSHVY
jgi:hypothetical protein